MPFTHTDARSWWFSGSRLMLLPSVTTTPPRWCALPRWMWAATTVPARFDTDRSKHTRRAASFRRTLILPLAEPAFGTSLDPFMVARSGRAAYFSCAEETARTHALYDFFAAPFVCTGHCFAHSIRARARFPGLLVGLPRSVA